MAVLDEIRIDVTTPGVQGDIRTPSEIRQQIADGFWKWYEAHKDDYIIRIRIFIFTIISKRVRDIRGVFVTLFGEPRT